MRNRLLLAIAAAAVAACADNGESPPALAGIVPVHEIQGSGAESPLAGQSVRARGVVSGDFQTANGDPNRDLGGFFLQQEQPDGDSRTSDGVFVLDLAGTTTDVSAGDLVEVAGTVTEHAGETRIAAASVAVVGSGSVQPVELQLPATSGLEAYEGMLVRLPQTLTVNDLYHLERYGEILLSQGGRRMQFTNRNAPGAAEFSAHQERSAARSVILDDGSLAQGRKPARYLFPQAEGFDGRPIRVGDEVGGLTGHIRFGNASADAGPRAYRLVPESEPGFVPANDRPVGAPDSKGSLTVASFNLLNFFTTLDDGRNRCGPAADSGCRGAESEQELARQLGKTVSALALLDADIVGLIELENNGNEVLRAIVAALNDAAGATGWKYLDTGEIGTDAIRVGFIYKPSVVLPTGPFALLDGTVDDRFNHRENRPMLAQGFRHLEQAGVLTVLIGHLKSKGSDCDEIGDPDAGDGQGNCNRTRARAVAALLDWLATDPTGSGDSDVLIIGDLNAYLREDPVRAIEAAGYSNLLREFAGDGAYSFVFRGASGALDHAFASPSLRPQVRSAGEWHINADEPPALDYNLDFGRDPRLFDGASPYRSSDHDPLVVGIEISGN